MSASTVENTKVKEWIKREKEKWRRRQLTENCEAGMQTHPLSSSILTHGPPSDDTSEMVKESEEPKVNREAKGEINEYIYTF